MAQIDSSIYFQQKPIDPFGSITSGIEQGQKLGDMIRQGRFNNAMRGAMTVDPTTGQPKFDQSKLADLYKADPQRAMQWNQQYQQQQAQMLKMQAEGMSLKADIAARKVSAVNDQASWDAVKGDLKTMGVAPGLLPDAYSPDAIKSIQNAALDTKTQIENQFKQTERDQKDRQLDIEEGRNKTQHEDAQARMAETRENRNERLDQRQELQDNMIHSRVVQRLQSNPYLQQKLTQYSNLQSAMSNFLNAEHPTAQSFDELQQAVRGNLGIKGASAVGEREHTTMNSLGLDASRMMQFITGNPQDIEKNAGFAKHMQDLVKLEKQNIDKQVSGHLNTLTAGHGSMYKRRPDLMGDLTEAKNAYGSEFSGQGGSGGAGGTSMSGRVQMRAPDGSIRAVPADQVEAAKAAGGQPL